LREDSGIDRKELLESVRGLRREGQTPKEIARTLGLSPSAVTPLIWAIAAEEEAAAPEREISGCWVSPGWSAGLEVPSECDWPDPGAVPKIASGLLSVLVTRDAGRNRVLSCSYLIDAY
jgi:hypothetical protein